MNCPKLPAKNFLFKENLEFPAVTEIDQILVTHKIRLILYLPSHKIVGLKAIGFAWEKLKFSEKYFFSIVSVISE